MDDDEQDFELIEANTELLFQQAAYLRWETQSAEWNKTGAHSREFLLRHGPSSKNAGCFRVLTVNSDYVSLPCEQIVEDALGYEFMMQQVPYPRHLMAEISSFTLASSFQSCSSPFTQPLASTRWDEPILFLSLSVLAVLYQGCYKYAYALLNPETLSQLEAGPLIFLQSSPELEANGPKVLVLLDVRESVDRLSGHDRITFTRLLQSLDQRARAPQLREVPELRRLSIA